MVGVETACVWPLRLLHTQPHLEFHIVDVSDLAGVDCVLRWNVRHLANPAKTDHLRRVCARLGLVPPVILTPDNYFGEDR
jgi:hypothetical protein